MKRYDNIFLLFCLLMITAGILHAENLQVSFINLTHGSRIPECQNKLIRLNASVDSSSIDKIEVYASGSRVFTARSEPWEGEWANPLSGYYQVWARVEDVNDNVAFSDTIGVVVGDLIDGDLILNGTFNCASRYWNKQDNAGASSTMTRVEDAEIAEGAAMLIDIINPGTEDWHVQLLQNFPIDSGHIYEISFVAETAGSRDIQYVFQENTGEYTFHRGEQVTLTGNGFYGPYTWECNVTDPNCAFRFYLGNSTAYVYFDDISIIDLSVEFPDEASAIKAEAIKADKYQLGLKNYPNPFNPFTTIAYELPVKSNVTLAVYDITGQLVETLVSRYQNSGQHFIQWDGTDYSSGVYLYQIETADFRQVKKMILMK